MKKWITTLLALLFIFSASSIYSTFAYFAQVDEVLVQSQVTVSKWLNRAIWDSSIGYKKGTIVYWNDELYIAKRYSESKELGVHGSQNFWEVYKI